MNKHLDTQNFNAQKDQVNKERLNTIMNDKKKESIEIIDDKHLSSKNKDKCFIL